MATDMAKPPQKRLSSTTQVSIVIRDVNDNAPEFITANETTIPENSPLNTVVAALKAIDRDEGQNSYVEYSIINSEATPFSLGPVDGLLRVAQKLDREIKSNYTLEIKAKDRGEPSKSSRTKFFIRLLDENDNNPIFDSKSYSASVPENISVGATVLQVSATDLDDGINGRVRYTIISGDDNHDLTISEDNGLLRIAKNLNYERKAQYSLTIQAEDCGGDTEERIRFDTATVSILVSDINDNYPVFLHSPYLALVNENTLPGPSFRIMTVQAHDADSLPFNGLVRYFLKDSGASSGNSQTQGGTGDLFRVNSTTGDIYLLKSLDREKQAEYLLTLQAMDSGNPPLSGTGIVRILVQDVNDHSPEFERQSYSASVSENLPAGSSVIQLNASDKDDGLNAKIRYSLLGENIDRFHVDSDTGLVTT
ncbi:cadherin-related tumor suppressor-like, partial [Diaphorina citri]|uniref:Cadherin-related tumor suppressor-like n=1 Tax=Diaphorina citri TaxID=121845 RepID=A0A3Q0JDP9_DIACI